MSATKGLAQSPIQAAIITLLKADATLVALVDGKIYDAIPDSTVDNYVAVGEWTETSVDTLEDGDAGIGSDCLLTIDIYTDDARGQQGYKQGQAIADRVKILLHQASLTVAGWTSVDCQHEDTVSMRDEDHAGRPKRHFVSTYSIEVEAA